jgi:hypothetical protein
MSDTNQEKDINLTLNEEALPEQKQLIDPLILIKELTDKVDKFIASNRVESEAFIQYLKQVQTELDVVRSNNKKLIEQNNAFTVAIESEVELLKVSYESSLNKAKQDLTDHFNTVSEDIISDKDEENTK